MNEQLKKIPEALKQFWKNTSKKIKIAIIAGIVVIIGVALALSIMLNKVEYVTIYEDLSASEVSEILAALQESGIPVRVEGEDGISVPVESETQVRMYLATQGYPKSGLSYYIIENNSGVLTTDYERRQYENMQLQERLGASIETLNGVKQAIVTVAQKDESIFYLTEKTEPSASVVVHMHDGYELTEEQILGIRNLVASSVPGLSKENISMMDGRGNDLLLEESIGNSTSKANRIAQEVEAQIKRKIEHMLDGPYGADHYKVSVTASINIDNLITEEMTYYPSPDGDNTGVIREETHATDNYESEDGAGGVPGTSTNADVNTYPTIDGESMTRSESTSDNIKYDVSYVKTLLEKNGAYIDDLSVGVVIDKPAFEPGERENLTELVAYSAGVPRESVTVQGFSFYTPPVEPVEEPQEFNQNILYIAVAGVILAIIIATIIVIMMRRKRKKLEQQAIEEAERLAREKAMAQSFGEIDEDMQKLEPIQDSIRQEIKDFAITNPEIAAQLIKSWLRADEDR